jgi:chorismate mutase/prephenate dehydrogenase
MSIPQLRERLAAVDAQVLGLAAERRHLVKEIGRAKEREGLPIRDYGQEKEVIERTRATALRLGMPEKLGEHLMQCLIHDALTAQEKQRVSTRSGGSGRNALVIGGAGRMGGWFVRFLASQGFAVEVADPAGPGAGCPWLADWRDSPLKHDLIVVATGLRAARQILEELSQRGPQGIVLDIGSIKTPLRGALEGLLAAGIRVTSIHPMFGPETELLSDRHVIFVDVGDTEATKYARDLFASTMAEQVEMSIDDHDRTIAFVLGLSHAINIAFFTALTESGKSAAALAALSSTTFADQIRIARQVSRENPRLYFEIQHLNAFGRRPLAALREAVDKLQGVVDQGVEEEFLKLMEHGRAYLSQLSEGG